MQQREARGLTSGVLTIGASACSGFSAGQGAISVQFQYLAGGTCSIVGQSTMVQGALLFAQLPQNFGGPLTCHFNVLSGATTQVQYITALSNWPGMSYIY